MAAAQTKGSSSSTCRYHVFLSFRGEDTRKNFTDHLYNALVRAGFHTFRDDDEIERGEIIGSQIELATQESDISIIIFSKDYASSRWCLNELEIIMERWRTGGHMVMPVFFDVDPSQLRKLTGRYGEAFARHEERFNNEMEKVGRWKAALKEVADLSGMVLQDRHQAQFIEDIVRKVQDKIGRRVPLDVPFPLVGADSYVDDINLWLQRDSDGVGVALIYGIGGVGKTTCAMTVYNQNFYKFEASSFLANVREASEQPDGLVRLQRQLLKDIRKRKAEKINNVAEGTAKIKGPVCCRRVLIVLDDVDELDDFDAIIGTKGWLYRGSKIIVTTRNQCLLRVLEPCVEFKIDPLYYEESMELFSWHAFGRTIPSEGDIDNSKRAVNYCGGLPLALKILGRSLRRQSTEVWKSALEEIEAIPDDKIQKILKISYNSLRVNHKDLFLDIACFFTGKDRDYVAMILGGFGFDATNGIQNLVDRCLLVISVDNEMMMHDLVRDMGREIIRQESPANPGKRSRLWHHKDAFNVLRGNSGTKMVRGLGFNMLMSKEGNSSMEHKERHPCERILKAQALAKMRNLKLLQLDYVKLEGNFTDFPKGLLWLSWHRFSMKFMPHDLDLDELLVLDMQKSHLKRVWRGTKFLSELKILNLSYSHDLVGTPNFTGLPSLEWVLLQDCVKLMEVHESICDLNRLALLNLRDCKSLKRLPQKLNMLTSLKELDLSGCSSLGKQPGELGKVESLRSKFGNTIVKISSVGHDILDSWLLPKKGALLSLPTLLVHLSLANCNLADNDIPQNLDCLHSLMTLDLRGNPISCLPETISNLTRLKSLYLSRCRRLKSLPALPKSLLDLNIDSCMSLEKIRNPSCLVGLDAQSFTSRSMCGKTGGYEFTGIQGTLRNPLLAEKLLVAAFHCVNLVEVEGRCRLEPPGLPNEVDLLDIGPLESFEVDMFFLFSGTTKKTAIQMWHDYSVSSIYYPSEMVSSFHWNRNELWLSKFPPEEKMTQCQISVTVPLVPDVKINGLLFSLLFSSDQSIFDAALYLFLSNGRWFSVRMRNEVTGKEECHVPTACGIPKAGKDLVWLGLWLFRDNVLKGGDEWKIEMNVPKEFYIKEFYIEPVFETIGSAMQFYGEAIGSTIPRHLSMFKKLHTYTWSRHARCFVGRSIRFLIL